MYRATSTRRQFLATSAAVTAAVAIPAGLRAEDKKEPFKISLAQWSLHKTLFDKKLDNRDFAKTAKEDFGIDAIEYVNQFWKDKAKDAAYVAELKKRAEDLGVKTLLIMCDGEGNLGDSDDQKRKTAVENHYKWVEAAKELGCHSIRVNAASNRQLSFQQQQELAADGLQRLSEFAHPHGLNVIVENHGGLSSNGAWLAGVMKLVDRKNCGTLPDFGNFRVSNTEEYDRYKGVDELMPFAKAVSAKSHDFNEAGDETHTDYFKMMDIVVKKHGYHGYCGIEYEGSKLSEADGIKATKELLERVQEKMAS
ncbi:MAG: sugar phosphate isomerase/epimerase [Planctomycetaceae bacterium]|nr:sugar phosphate isomerase/epimerase [Planctomycetaceae bacterium]